MLTRMLIVGVAMAGLGIVACDMQNMMGNDNMNTNTNNNGNNGNANNNANANNNDNEAPKDGDNEVVLDAITFNIFRQFPATDPAIVAAGNGTVTFSGGRAASEGLPGLYADDSYSWVLVAPNVTEITFDGLDVVRMEGYWVHPDTQPFGATMVVAFSDGSEAVRSTAEVSALGDLGQPQGFMMPVEAPAGATIDMVTLFHDAGAEDDSLAALDVLTLTVLDNAG